MKILKILGAQLGVKLKILLSLFFRFSVLPSSDYGSSHTQVLLAQLLQPLPLQQQAFQLVFVELVSHQQDPLSLRLSAIVLF